MKVFRLLGIRRLRQQPLRAAMAVLAVGAGVSLVVSIFVVTTSVNTSVREFGRSLAGPAPLRIVGATTTGGLTLGTVEAAAAVDGVTEVVPMVQAVTLADRTRDVPGESEVAVLALGVDCRVEALIGALGCDEAALAAAGDGPVLAGPGIGTLDSLRTDTGRVSIAGLPVVDELSDLNDGRVVVFSLAGAQRRFLQEGRVDVGYVVPDDGADLGAVRRDLEGAVGAHNGVLGAADPPPETQVVLVTFLPLFSILGLFGLGTGAVLVHNTVALSLEERRRQLAILGALGAGGRTVVGGAVGESVLLGVAGGVLGTVGGIAVAGTIVGSLSGFTESVAGVALHRHTPASMFAIGILLGAVVAAAAALLPARRAIRMDVAAELSGRGAVSDARPIRLARRVALWTGIAAVAVVACWSAQIDGGIEPWQATVGPLGFLVLAVAAPLVGSALAPLLLRRAAGASRGSRRPNVVLALAELVRDPRRTGIMAVAVTSPIIIGFATDGFVSSARAGITESFAGADGVSVSTIDVNGGVDAFLGPDALAALAALPGVAQVQRGSFVAVGHDIGDLIGVGAYEDEDLENVDVIVGSADPVRLDNGEVLIGPGLARRTGARPGDTIELDTPNGTVRAPVQGVLQDGNFGGFNVTMSYRGLTELYGPQPPAFVVLEPADGVSEAELAATVRQAGPSIDPTLRVLTTEELVDEIVTSIDTQMLPFHAMRRALQVVAFVAVLSTLLLTGMQRRREHGLLAAVGARPPDIGRLVVTQAAAVGGAAVVCACLSGPLLLWSMLQILPILVGNRNPFDPDWPALGIASVTGVLLAMAASAWPAWRASRVEVLDALRYE